MSEPAEFTYKAVEIEELADVYFFRPLGMIFARLARAGGLTPTMVTIVGAIIGMIGGALLYEPRLAYLAFALIIFHSVLDSSDGQLARMTGQVSDLGRLVDGLGSLAVYLAIVVAILASTRGRVDVFTLLAFLAAVVTLIHAQMYDYHRTAYISCVIKGVVTPSRMVDQNAPGFLHGYDWMERLLAGDHERVMAAVMARSASGRVQEDDRERYRASFYWPVRGWNLMGDNTRFYAVGLLAIAHRLDLFFYPFILLGMNAAFMLLWFWQVLADKRFLASL